MITLIVGHRGSGKSNLLSYLHSSGVPCLDLDLKIQQVTGESIKNLFSIKGESFFRNLEKDTLYKIINDYKASDKSIYISVGAGFLDSIPAGVKVIWLQRKTDAQGRVFFDRPRLDQNKSPFAEYKDRFLLREKYYQSIAHETFCFPEYLVESQLKTYKNHCPFVEKFRIHLQKLILFYFPIKKDFVIKDKTFVLNKGGITLEEDMLKDRLQAKIFLQKRLTWGILFFEVRDDLISKQTFSWIKSIVPLSQLLLSCRSLKTYFTAADLESAWGWDWPMEKTLESCPFKIPFSIISLHSTKPSQFIKENIFSYLDLQIDLANKHNKQYSVFKKVHCKWAPNITNVEELQNLYMWFKKDKDHRSILPMSLKGRWSWFRLYLYGRMKINFIKESRGSVFKDQILLTDKVLADKATDKIFTDSSKISFAAILGKPISQSLTPFVHYDFFQKREIAVYSIVLTSAEVTEKNIDFLIQLGLKYAAITSPLKKEFFHLKSSKVNLSIRAKQRKSVNTLTVQDNQKKWVLDNTDQEGLVFLMDSVLGDLKVLDSKKITNLDLKKKTNYKKITNLDLKKSTKKNIALWGAGGVSSMLSEVYPKVFIFSAQKKQCISHPIDEEDYYPDVVLWAVPSIYSHKLPEHWNPSVIIDFNYSEDSGGREYAILKNATYTNGLLMFLEQAKQQQELWSQEEVKV